MYIHESLAYVMQEMICFEFTEWRTCTWLSNFSPLSLHFNDTEMSKHLCILTSTITLFLDVGNNKYFKHWIFLARECSAFVADKGFSFKNLRLLPRPWRHTNKKNAGSTFGNAMWKVEGNVTDWAWLCLRSFFSFSCLARPDRPPLLQTGSVS